ncbi:MAG: CARDB domain-containing protein [Bacteroidota bacterium]
MKKITLLFVSFATYLCSLAQDARISSSETPSSASINQTIAIRTELTNSGTAPTPSFRLYYFLNTSPNLNGNPIPLNLTSNIDGSIIPDSNFDVVRALSPGADDDENHFPRVPDGLTTGTYYIIWELDINDQNTSNNLRARSIFINGVTPAPDLVVTNATVLGGPFTPGQQISVNARVRNQGVQNAGTSTLQYWISSNATIGTGDEMLATDAVQSLAVNQTSSSESASLTLPLDRLDTQYIIFRADGTDSVDEGDNENNNTVAIPIQIEGDPDLEIDTFNTVVISDCTSCSSRLSQLGSDSHRLNTSSSPLRINSIRVQNTGDSDAPQSRLAYFVSADNQFDDDDIQIGQTRNVNSISEGGFRDIAGGSLIAADFPDNLKNNQPFFVLIVVDDNDLVDEGDNEDNNVAPIRLRISSSAGKGPIITPIVPFALRADLNGFGLSPLDAYNIEVFDLSGQQVLSKTVTSPYEENSEVYQLNSGIYIIKSEKGTRKVYVN